MQKTFVAISSEIKNNKLVYLTTSAGDSLKNENGIDCEQALDFLFNLVHKRDNKCGIAFVCYAFSRDNEFIFSTMPSSLRDKLFISYTIKRNIEELETELEDIESIYYATQPETPEHELADFERYVNNLSISELTEVKYKGYHILLRNGKILTLRKNGKSISIYDVYGFFEKPLYESVKTWLDKDVPALKKKTLGNGKIYATIEAQYVSLLATKLNNELTKYSINLSRYHGASAVTSYILGLLKAKKSFHHYRYRRQISTELHKATFQATYAGRSEQFKIGTIKNVNVYDINSAYAHASTFLPVMLSKPQAVTGWQPQPFSIWFCEYDFSNINAYLGYLPNRSVNNRTQYKLKGRGYFWQPEIVYILQNFPECIEIKNGFILGYEQAPFAKGIKYIYKLRQELQASGHPLEKILKLALASIYGKFAQYHGKGHFYNPFYAGFITSFTRAQLLNAVKGYEDKTICFQTDAIHTTAVLPIQVSGDLGEYKLSQYNKITYLDNGVYTARKNDGKIKTKTRGFRSFDFDKAIAELKERRSYSALVEFFIGHNLSVKNFFGRERYLQDYKTTKEINPVADEQTAMRIFEITGIDLTESYFDSKPISLYSGVESSIYRQNNAKETDMALDSVLAERI